MLLDVLPQNASAPSLSLLHPIQPASMVFLQPGQTQEQVAQILYNLIYVPKTRRNRIWLLASEFEVIITFIVCTAMLIKKKSLGKLWIITKRDSHYGSFYVANAVFVIVLGVSGYLIAWDLTAIVIAGFSFANLSAMEWWWVIPLPWWPLVTGAYISVHGFTVGCSPRSPLSAVNGHITGARRRWIYLPVPTSPAIVNTTLILPCVLFSLSTFILTGFSGHHYYTAKHLAQHILPPEIREQIHNLAHHHAVTFSAENANMIASDDLIRVARTVAAAYYESHRFVCINLTVFASCAWALFIPYVIYGLPNLVSLVDHACSRHPQPLPENCTTFLRKLYFLLTKGKPKSEHSTTHLSLTTWKMTILAIGYILILIVCVPAFAWLPVYLVSSTFPGGVLKGDIGQPMSNAILAVSVITICSCTFVAFFCTVATLDPLFRAAIGLNMIRTQVPIDIQVTHHKSMHQEEQEPESPRRALSRYGMLSDQPLYQGRDRSLVLKPSMSTLQSRPRSPSPKSPTFAADCMEYPVSLNVSVEKMDIESGLANPPPTYPKRGSI